MQSPVAPSLPPVLSAKADTVLPAVAPSPLPPGGTFREISFREILAQLDRSQRQIMVNPLQNPKLKISTETKALIGYQIQVSRYSLKLEMCSRIVEGLTSTTKKLQSAQ